MADHYEAVVGAGTMRSTGGNAVPLPHRWTSEGVTVEITFTGAHLLHLAVAGCVLNDLYREAGALGIQLDGVRVVAEGAFDPEWSSTGVSYSVELDTPAAPHEVDELLRAVDTIAEIPRTIRAGASVRRVP
jgi:hypothetical protein